MKRGRLRLSRPPFWKDAFHYGRAAAGKGLVMSAEDRRYRAKAGKEIDAWKRKKPSRVMQALSLPGKFLGFPIRKLLETERGRDLLQRATETLLDAGTWRFEPEKVLAVYRQQGFRVADLAEVQKSVPMSVMDAEAKKHLKAATGTLIVEGGIAGPAMAVAAGAAGTSAAGVAVASGGAAGPSAGAAGLAVVGGATAVETVFLIGFCCRRLAAIAACYGYDVRDEHERAFALSTFNVAVAENLEAKEAALADLGSLAGRLALKKQHWAKLEETSAIAKAIRQLAEKLGQTLTQRQLKRALGVVGAALGAGFNGHLGYTTTRAGYHLYRQRVLARADIGETGTPRG